MDLNQLRNLLTQDEYGRLEFKREWYKLDSENSETKKRERGELTKDVLSLANGNIIVAGEEAYLIIGADPKIEADGRRATHDVDPNKITP
jgi:hypothetical protein